MILIIKKILFIFVTSKFNTKKNLSYLDLNFRKIDFTNYKIIIPITDEFLRYHKIYNIYKSHPKTNWFFT